MIDEKKLAELRDWYIDMSTDEQKEALDTIETLLKIARCAEALADSFERMRKDHDEKLGKSFEEANENWDKLLQEPLDFGPLLEALKPLKGE